MVLIKQPMTWWWLFPTWKSSKHGIQLFGWIRSTRLNDWNGAMHGRLLSENLMSRWWRIFNRGPASSECRYTDWVPIKTPQLDEVAAPLDKFLRTTDREKFKGRGTLGECLFCSERQMRGAIAGAYRDRAEMDEWRAINSQSGDCANGADRMNGVATFMDKSVDVNLHRFEWNRFLAQA